MIILQALKRFVVAYCHSHKQTFQVFKLQHFTFRAMPDILFQHSTLSAFSDLCVNTVSVCMPTRVAAFYKLTAHNVGTHIHLLQQVTSCSTHFSISMRQNEYASGAGGPTLVQAFDARCCCTSHAARSTANTTGVSSWGVLVRSQAA
jgi:hypothetical protein